MTTSRRYGGAARRVGFRGAGGATDVDILTASGCDFLAIPENINRVSGRLSSWDLITPGLGAATSVPSTIRPLTTSDVASITDDPLAFVINGIDGFTTDLSGTTLTAGAIADGYTSDSGSTPSFIVHMVGRVIDRPTSGVGRAWSAENSSVELRKTSSAGALFEIGVLAGADAAFTWADDEWASITCIRPNGIPAAVVINGVRFDATTASGTILGDNIWLGSEALGSNPCSTQFVQFGVYSFDSPADLTDALVDALDASGQALVDTILGV